MKSKVFATIILILIAVLLTGLLLLYWSNTNINTVSETIQKKEIIPLLFSFQYDETINDTTQQHIVSVLVLLHTKTNRIGILELPGNTGINNTETQLIEPIDRMYSLYDYDTYVEALKTHLGVPNLQYIFIEKKDLPHFIDLIGGLQIFLINEEYTILDINTNRLNAGVGDMYFDGVGGVDYIQNMENPNTDELLKSTLRKEFIISLLSQLQLQYDVFNKSKTIINVMRKYIHSSLNKKELTTILLAISSYNLEQMYFQRLAGRVRNVTLNSGTDEEMKINILFTSNEIGGLSKIVASMTQNLSKEYTDTSSEKITLTILNGTIVNNLARNTKKIYEDAGFQVVFIGNAERNDIETTTIIDRTGNKINANFAATVVGVKSIITDITSVDQAGAELTLILGRDFDGTQVK